MTGNVWRSCLQKLQSELSATEFNTWIKPLQVQETDSEMALYAPNPFFVDWIRQQYLDRINEFLEQKDSTEQKQISLHVGNLSQPAAQNSIAKVTNSTNNQASSSSSSRPATPHYNDSQSSGFQQNNL
ncbi:MAG: chromosomal replication initiator protein DnaA, partial [Kangiella sp.]|nr:chromosomal replication initiator protein DnaA [Kangiella sp.]